MALALMLMKNEPRKKKFFGILYLIIGLGSLIYGMYYLAETYQIYEEITRDYLVFLIPSFLLTGITFFYGIKFLK